MNPAVGDCKYIFNFQPNICEVLYASEAGNSWEGSQKQPQKRSQKLSRSNKDVVKKEAESVGQIVSLIPCTGHQMDNFTHLVFVAKLYRF